MRSPSPRKDRPRPGLSDTLRELASGLDSRAMGRLLSHEAPEAIRQLAGEREPEGRKRGMVRRVLRDSRDVLVGLTHRLSPPRRTLFLASLVSTVFGILDIEMAFGERRTTEIERTAENRDKTGVFTGAYAINPVNGARIPIWIADYVMITYGRS